MPAADRPEDEVISDAVRAAVDGALGEEPHEEVAELSTDEVPELIEGKPFYIRHFLGPLGQ